MKRVVFGFLGSTMDSAGAKSRWDRWRPTVALCQHENLLIDKFVLFYQERSEDLLKVIAEDIHAVSPETELIPQKVKIKDAWDLAEVYTTLLDFAKTYPFKPEKEEYLVHMTTGTHIIQICLYLLVEAKYFPARLLQTSPPKKYSGEPGTFSIIDLDLSQYDEIWSRFQAEKTAATSFLKSGIETRNQRFNTLIAEIEQVALASRAPILLNGPTGAGKSLLATKVFALKKQRHLLEGEFVEVNCATLRGDAAMSTLFGHVKGAFTGATQDRQGLLRKAHQGLLFLDEIGELGLDEQAMLLRALEEKRFFPYGSDKEITSDFQLIAGTNRDLYADVRKGKFREDLLARINLWNFSLPGLAERREDISPNVEFELERYSRQNHIRIRMNAEAKTAFLKFAESPEAKWSGNFRDLNAAISRMATLSPDGNIKLEQVKAEMQRLRRQWGSGQSQDSQLTQRFLGERCNEFDLFDLMQLDLVLRICLESNSISEAGRRLYQVSRNQKKSANDADRLAKYLARFDLTWAQLQTR